MLARSTYHKTPTSSNGTTVNGYLVGIINTSDYSPFGVQLDGRTVSNGRYRYGFGGHEKLDEVQGTGNIVDMGDRWLNTQIGRTFKTDAKAKKYPSVSPYSYTLNNPIIFIDPDGKEVIWHSSLRNNASFKPIIEALEKTEVFKQIHQRFIENQDNIIYTKMWQGDGAWAWAKGHNGAGYVVEFASELFESGTLVMDPTLAAKVLLHEGLHEKWRLAEASEGRDKYPTLSKHDADPSLEADHETMAVGYISTFVDGMKQFDKESGAEHSEDWYNAMAWWGSLSRVTNAWKNLDEATRKKYESIQTNEQNYMDYQRAKVKYDKKRTGRNKSRMEAAYKKIDQKLFNQTRNRSEDAKIE